MYVIHHSAFHRAYYGHSHRRASLLARRRFDRDERLQTIIEEKRRKLEKDLAVEQNVIRNNSLSKT